MLYCFLAILAFGLLLSLAVVWYRSQPPFGISIREHNPKFYTAPIMTEEEIFQTRVYLWRKHYEGYIQWLLGPPEETQADLEASKEELEREKRRAQLAEQWERQQAEQQAAAELAAAKLAAIPQDFPAWLIDFAEQRNFPKDDYATLQALQKWIAFIVTYAQDNLNGEFSVRKVYAALRDVESPLEKSTSHHFFFDLASTLEKQGLLVKDDPNPKIPRRLVPDVLSKL